MRQRLFIALLITLLCVRVFPVYAQDTPPPQEAQPVVDGAEPPRQPPAPVRPVPDLPNTCRGSEQVNEFLREVAASLSDSEAIRMKVGELGHSQRGTPILMVTVTSAQRPSPGPGGLMVVARQHGDEPAGTRAALELIRCFALNQSIMAALIGDLTVRIIPVANPDGMDLFQRRTANGSDMNRDWNARRLPETRAVTLAINASRPQVLMDLHELTPRDGNHPYVLGIPALRAADILGSVRSAFSTSKLPVSTRTTERHSTTGLLHRHFVQYYGGIGFLVESKYAGDPARYLKARGDYHLQTVIAAIEGMAKEDIP